MMVAKTADFSFTGSAISWVGNGLQKRNLTRPRAVCCLVALARLLVVERRHRDGGLAFIVEPDAHQPGLAAYLAVFDILLDRATARIDEQLAPLPAVWARDRSHVVEVGIQVAVMDIERFEVVKVHATGCNPTLPSASFLLNAEGMRHPQSTLYLETQ